MLGHGAIKLIWRNRKNEPLLTRSTVDSGEIARFMAMAEEWWDSDGKFHTLHQLNPVRLAFIRDRICTQFGRDPNEDLPLDGLRMLDIGCGGGLLSEPLAFDGAEVLGIDATAKLVEVARTHAALVGAPVTYRHALAEDLVEAGERFDVILNAEVVEHVANVDRFLGSCCRMLKPGGIMIVATLNRTLKSLLFAKIAGEYILGLLPRGTHDWRRFIKPSELAAILEAYGVRVEEVVGVGFNPILTRFRITTDSSVNYMVVAERPRLRLATVDAGPPLSGAQAGNVTVFYDGACPLCAAEIGYYKARRGSETVNWVDVSACEAVDVIPGLARDDALRRFHVRTSTGQVISGGRAFAVLWSSLSGFRWLGRVFRGGLPARVLDWLYDRFLPWRPRLQALARRRASKVERDL